MKKFVFAIPLIAISLLASCGPKTKTYHTVSFDTDGGEPTIEPIEVEHGLTMAPPKTIPMKAATLEHTYAFKEWQLNGTTFNFENTPITTDGITLKAKYTESIRKYIVTIDSKNGEDSVVVAVEYGNSIPEEYRPKETPTKEDNYRTYIFDGWHKVTTSGMEEKEFNFETETITEDTRIEAKWERGESKTYTLNVVGDPNQQLWFGTSRTETFTQKTITAGEQCSFYVFARYGTEYKVPDMVDVYVGNSEVPLKDDFDYHRVDDTMAEIRINGNTICDNIRVEAAPVKNNYYSIEIINYGVKHNCAVSEWKTEDELVIQFSEDDDNHDLPLTDNFYVRFDSDYWGKLSDYSEYCTYDEGMHKLTVHQYKVLRSMAIKVRSPHPSYNLPDDLTWKQIKDISESGWAEDIFYLDEEKMVAINGINHKTKIIGFNHDTLSNDTSKTAGITFEFMNVITDANGVEKVSWNNDGSDSRNYNFTKYILNDFLNNDGNSVFNRLPNDLQEAIKKGICTFTDKYTTDIPYNTKLFPLSYYEITAQVPEWSMKEGRQYDYWKIHKKEEDRIKTGVDKTSGSSYWTRSPYTGLVWFSYCVSDLGVPLYSRVNDNRGVAPAFCI